MAITVALVEDDPRIRRSLAAMLATAHDIECVGQFASAEEALQKIPSLKPRVVFMDINLPGLSGVECVRGLAAVQPKPQIVMLTSYDDSEAIFSSLSAGACGYLLKPIRTAQLLAAVRDVFSGGSPMTGHIARRVVEEFNKPAAGVLRISRISHLLARTARAGDPATALRGLPLQGNRRQTRH